MAEQEGGKDVNFRRLVEKKSKNMWNRVKKGNFSNRAKKSQRGGALARRKVHTIDKVAEGMSMFLSGLSLSFAKLGLKLGSTGAKALKSVVDQYRR